MLKVVHPRCVAATWWTSVVLVCALTVIVGGTQSPVQLEQHEATFNVFFRSAPIGVERVSVTRTSDGWTIRSSGQLGAPFALETRLFVVEYDSDWHAQRLFMDGARIGQDFSIETTFGNGVATNRIRETDRESNTSEPVDATVVVLPDYFFGAYEALAPRLFGARPGDVVPVYAVPRGATDAVVEEVLTQSLEIAQSQMTARIYRIRIRNPNQSLDAEVWVDEGRRLMRVVLPTVGFDVVRQDISLISTRLSGVRVPGDVEQRISGNGFTLAATVTLPVDRETPADGWPAVVLVPGTRSADRDEHQSGFPLFGRLASILSDAGYLVARYDRRGVGQSGGRPESATLENYSEDVRAVVEFLEDSDDVDDDRIALVAHGEGGWIALHAASRENSIAAVILMATPATDGPDLVLEQQRAELDRLQAPEAERDERIKLQRQIHDAVLGDGSWDGVPAMIRQRADTPWFRSFLEFEPADVTRRTRQPLLVMHGELDRQVPSHHADQLAEFARVRRREESTVDLVLLPGVNHLMVSAETDERAAEYVDLSDPEIAPEVASTLTAWLNRIMKE